MNLYDQYLALLQMFFHKQDVRPIRHKTPDKTMPVSEKELFREAA